MKSSRWDVAGFVENLAGLTFENVFNPYAERCGDFDSVDAAAIRRRNLSLVLEAAITRGIDSFWIARDLGYRGGRRTGLALTDEKHLASHSELVGSLPLSRATFGPEVVERTAGVVWKVLNELNRPIFLWNVFPLHPHERGDQFSNRCHTKEEREACRPLLAWLLEQLRPRTIVAIGREAERALEALGVCAVRVRHPSYGGHLEFVAGMHAHYDYRPRR
jgi:hypothetical protein